MKHRYADKKSPAEKRAFYQKMDVATLVDLVEQRRELYESHVPNRRTITPDGILAEQDYKLAFSVLQTRRPELEELYASLTDEKHVEGSDARHPIDTIARYIKQLSASTERD